METSWLHLSVAKALPGRTRETPFVFVADDAFPLQANMMKSYPGGHKLKVHQRV